jgi:hypothetical protein
LVTPYLRLKHEQAAVMMQFIRHRKHTRQGRQGGNGRFFAPLSADIMAYRDRLYRQMKALNAKGPAALSLTRART